MFILSRRDSVTSSCRFLFQMLLVAAGRAVFILHFAFCILNSAFSSTIP